MRLRRLGQNTLMVMGGLLIGLLVVEGLVRSFSPQIGVGWDALPVPAAYRWIYRLRSVYGYELGPNVTSRDVRQPEFRYTFETNRDGLRDRDFGEKNSAYRIVGLGDSFTFGIGVDLADNYLKVLERRLRERYGAARVEVVNAGISGYGTAQEYHFLRERMLAYDPDLVLVGFYMGNDVLENVDFESVTYVIDEQGFLTKRGVAPPADMPNRWQGTLPIPFKDWLRRHSHAYYFGMGKYHDLKVALGLLAPTYPGSLELHRVDPPAHIMAAWEKTWGWLERMKQLLDARGKDLVVVMIPSDFQVNALRWRGVRRFYRLDTTIYALDKPQEVVAGFCARARIRCLDLLAGFRARAGPDRRLYYHEGHWNADGHALAAELISERLVADAMIAPRGGG